MANVEHWFCPGCGEIDGPRAGMTCHGPGMTGGCASVGNEVVEISHDAAERLQGAVEAIDRAYSALIGSQYVGGPSEREAYRIAVGALGQFAAQYVAQGGRYQQASKEK